VSDYFYALTLQWNEGQIVNVRTRSGLVESVADGMTQQEIFQAVFNAACEYFGAPKLHTSVIYYYAARNSA
jgi:hypothetical protein